MLTSLPNLLTLSRILVIPLFMAAFYIEGVVATWIAFILFVVAGVTDYFDGYFARRQRQVSPLGRFLDPVADKLLVAAAVVMLVAAGRAPVVAAIIILCRELLVSGLREYLAERRLRLPVSRLAKWKTTVQLVSIGALVIAPVLPWPSGVPFTLLDFGALLFWLAAVLSLITGYDYLRIGLQTMLRPGKTDTGKSGEPVG